MADTLRTKLDALGAYHLLISDKHRDTTLVDEGGGHTRKIDLDTMDDGGGEGNRTPGPLRAKQVLSR